MEVKINSLAHDIEDEGLITFLAFCYRVSRKYGFDSWYQMNIEDVAILCNKTSNGIEEWLREQCGDYLGVGRVYSNVMAFKLTNRRFEKKLYVTKELKTERAKIVWSYTLGCFNHNLLQDEIPYDKNRSNAGFLSCYNITREAQGYIPVAERKKK